MLRLILLNFFFLLLVTSYGMNQKNRKVDSLENLLQQTHKPDKKLEYYIPLIREYRNTNITNAKYLSNQALKLAKGIQSQRFLAKIYGILGDIAIAEDSVELARSHYELALLHYEEVEITDGIISILTILGNIAFIQDDLTNALQFYHRAINLAQEFNYQKRLHILYINIGSVLIKTSEYIESLRYTSSALTALLEMGDTLQAAICYSNLGIVSLETKDYQAANRYLNEALTIYKNYDASISIASTYMHLSRIEQAKGNYEKAIRLLLISKSLADKNMIEQFEGPKRLLQNNIDVRLGMNYLLLNKLDNAYTYLLNGLNSSIKNRQLENSKNASDYLYRFWDIKGNADSALAYHRIFKSYSDTLKEEINNRKLARQEAKFSFEQQAKENLAKAEEAKEKQTRSIISLVVTIIVLIIILGLLILLLRLNKTKLKQSELIQQNLRNEIELKNKELTTYLIYQVKNNEFIVNISDKLKKILWKANDKNKQLVNELIREIETDASSDNWDEFIVRFQQVHTDFYKNLGTKYPDLTSNELRLCAFLKLNMNTKDIAAITYQSTKSITVARWRLRQKLSLKKEERLAAFLSKF